MKTMVDVDSLDRHSGPRPEWLDIEPGSDGDVRAFYAIHLSATIWAEAINERLRRHVHVNPNATIRHDADPQAFISINQGAAISGEVVVGADTLVGAAAIVLQGLNVGERVVVGAGSVVTKDIPGDAVVVGVPGRW